MMQSPNRYHEMESLATFAGAPTRPLTVAEERDLLTSLADCKAKLAATLASIKGVDEIPSEPQGFTRFVADFYAGADQDAFGQHLGVIFAFYLELRSKLAMANLKLVAHVAQQYRDRGVLYSDLLQEGFCGLLEAIDRFDPAHETKLATYAIWWIRQAMQLAIAAGAYPVRLRPRHLLELAQYHHAVDQGRTNKAQSETIKRIQAATRPSVALNGAVDGAFFDLSQPMTDSEADLADDFETAESFVKLIGLLQPREQEVLSLRFGLGGVAMLSLSQVGKVVGLSKERVRQIQDRAIAKLRVLAAKNLTGEEGHP